MSSAAFLILLGGLLVLAFLAEEALRRFRFPPVLALMGFGAILGPLTAVLPSDAFLPVAPHFGALAFLLILFEGGLDLRFSLLARHLAPGVRLGAAGFAAAAAGATLLAAASGMASGPAIALGLVVAPVSGAIVLPLAARVGFREEIRTVVVLEAALADVLAVLAMSVFGKLATGGGLGGLLAAGSVLAAALSVGLAAIAGLVWPRVLRRLGDRKYVDALTFGLALAMWGGVESLGASGALAVLTFGATLSNEEAILRALRLDPEGIVPVAEDVVKRLHEFIGQLTFVVRAFFFVFLGALLDLRSLSAIELVRAGGLVGVFLLLRRALLSSYERRGVLSLDAFEARAVWLLQPRGLVSAVLALEAHHLGVPGADALVRVASLVIVLTNLLLPVGLSGRRLSGGAKPSSEVQ